MVVLGLILVLVAVVAGVVLVYENSGSDHTVSISAFGGTWQADAFWLAVVGAAILLVGVLGVALMRAGGKRGLRRRQERKQLERENAALADRVRHEDHDAARAPQSHPQSHPQANPPAGSTDRVDPGSHAAPPSYDPMAGRDDRTYDTPPPTSR